MAQYKCIPYEFVEHTELARKSYLEYERGMGAPDEAEVEAEWVAERKKLHQALDKLTSRQRQVYIMKAGYGLEEQEIAKKLNITQQAVSDRYRRAENKLQQFRE